MRGETVYKTTFNRVLDALVPLRVGDPLQTAPDFGPQDLACLDFHPVAAGACWQGLPRRVQPLLLDAVHLRKSGKA